MAKLLDTAITAEDLRQFLEETSDFAFELQAFRLLRDCKFHVEHGGTYDDPHTKIPRQFDFRATRFQPFDNQANIQPWLGYTLRLAVECKNLKTSNPLLVSCVPRSAYEAHHNVAVRREYGGAITGFREAPETFNPYKIGEPVGKVIDQVGRTVGTREVPPKLVSDDRELYEKWSQALGSGEGVVQLAVDDQRRSPSTRFLTEIFPVVLIPERTLWTCNFVDGEVVTGPTPATWCSFYVGKRLRSFNPAIRGPYTFSHFEICTPQGFIDMLVERDVSQSNARMEAMLDFVRHSI